MSSRATVLLAVLLTGCAWQRVGTAHPLPGEGAAWLVMDPRDRLEVEAIDEERPWVGSDRFELPAGRYTLRLRRRPSSEARVTLTLEAEAGHTYRLRVSPYPVTSMWTVQVDHAWPSRPGVPAADIERACRAGHAVKCVELGTLYELGTLELGWNEARAAQLYAQACTGDETAGCLHLGSLYEAGHGVELDEARAATLYERACATEVRACTRLGVLYQEGRGVRKDERRASQVLDEACRSGDPAACTSLGSLYKASQDEGPDDEAIAALYRRGCDGGDPHGCTRLGSQYEEGLGVEHDARRAAELYERGCSGGSALGCTNLGALYRLGLGVVRSERRAMEMFKRGCSRGAATACIKLPSPDQVPEQSVKLSPETAGLQVGARFEMDLLRPRYIIAFSAELSGQVFSLAGLLLLGSPSSRESGPVPAARLEARLLPYRLGPLRPYGALGVTASSQYLAGRAALGLDVQVGRIHLFSDVAAENATYRLFWYYMYTAILVSFGASWRF